MEVSLTEFRQNTKKYFDLAIAGQVFIKRGGVLFELRSTARGTVGQLTVVEVGKSERATGLLMDREPELRVDATKGTSVATLIPKSSRFDNPLCKIHGLPLDGRGRCLQKGCKYA